MDEIITEKYKMATNRLILLDYDGTLVDFEAMPDRSIPSARLLRILKTIAQKPKTDVFVISGRQQVDLENFLGGLPINIIAEHGAVIKKNGKWKRQIKDYGLWKKIVLPIFEQITSSCTHSFVEEKLYSLTWHYRNARADLGYKQSRELIRALSDSKRTFNLRIIDGNKIVEVMNNTIDKGIAVKKVMMQNNYDYVLSIGDDQTDEDMFLALSDFNNVYTIKVGEGETIAQYKLKSTSEVLNLLQQVSA